MFLKKLLRKRVIIWGAVTIFMTALLIVANSLAAGRFSTILDNVFGGDRAIIAEGDNGIDFHQKFHNKEDARSNGNDVVREICDEGMVLLKNENALPLKKNAKVSVFGKNADSLVYGGSGSAAPSPAVLETCKSIYDSLEEAGFSYNPTLRDFYHGSASGAGRPDNPKMENGGVSTLATGETPISSYSKNITDSYDAYGDAALVVISRIAGENWDLPRVAADDPSRHYLELDNNERDLLKHICDSGKFEHVIVLLNSSNYIDFGFLKLQNDPAYNAKIDGAIVIGSPGANGIMALGDILSGKVNPSGHTVDTLYTDYENDPTWQNFGENFTADGSMYLDKDGNKIKGKKYYLMEYEENIYVGYRYYETRGKTEGDAWYNKNVIYPFGYGLSYTTFTQELANKAALEGAELKANEGFKVEVKVKNTGNVPGKQVVQLYAEAPYTNGGIEKPYKLLVGFAKTKLLAPNEEETVEIDVNPYYFASFDSQDKNNNSFKGYELEAGNYVFHLGTDAHTDFDTFTKALNAGYKYENDPVTGNKVEALFSEVTEHMNESLSRSDFAATMPHTITDDERKASDETVAALDSYETTNNEVYNTMPTTGAEVTVEFKELIGLDYDDPKWASFLDQMTFDEMLLLFNEGLYQTQKIERLGVPKTISADGPTGFVNFQGAPEVYDSCYYMSECILAQTYNLELADAQGDAVGNESLVGNLKGDGRTYPGWYAPGVNIHRSPFSGRNTEYYSEDSFINGKFAARLIKAVQAKGVYVNIKHYAVNDQETHRSHKGLATWLDEQAMREIYLRSFEIAVKEGNPHGLMTSFNRIGTEWAGGSYRLCTTILRNEWGFVGSVICDYHTDKYMDSKQMLYAGGDINLCGDNNIMLQTDPKYKTPTVDPTNAKDVALLRRSAHNNLYAIVNSNAMAADIIGYNTAYWKIGLTVGTWVTVALLIGWGGFVIATSLLAKDKKETGAVE